MLLIGSQNKPKSYLQAQKICSPSDKYHSRLEPVARCAELVTFN